MRFPLGTPNKFEAARKARAIWQSLRSRGWGETLAEFYPKKARECPPPKTNATIGDFLAEVRTLHASKARMIEGYAVALRKIAADIAGLESGRRGGDPTRHEAWREKVEKTELASLAPAKILAWREEFVARAGNDPLRRRSAQISAASFLRRARSLFAPRLIQGLESVRLPVPLPFSGIKLERRKAPRYQSTFNVAQLVEAAKDELAEPEPEQFKIFVLAIMAGLRRNEIDKAEWSWFNWDAGQIQVTATRYFRTKSEESARSVWLPPEALEIFRGYRARATGSFVIESACQPITDKFYDTYRAGEAISGLIGWLRSKGVNGTKPLHTLRKEYGSLICSGFGLFAAKQMLGHADITTTAEHYLETKDKPMIGLGALLKEPENVIPLEAALA
jgi:integrase